jgi:hypothetical protein
VTTSPEFQNKLIDLLRSLSPIGSAPTSSSPSSNPLPIDCCAPFARRCAALENAAVENDFHQMVSYMELALHIQWSVLIFSRVLFSLTFDLAGASNSQWEAKWASASLLLNAKTPKLPNAPFPDGTLPEQG